MSENCEKPSGFKNCCRGFARCTTKFIVVASLIAIAYYACRGCNKEGCRSCKKNEMSDLKDRVSKLEKAGDTNEPVKTVAKSA